ncbi:MAG: MFS transporter [Candidatus Nanopelagicales bacterium]
MTSAVPLPDPARLLSPLRVSKAYRLLVSGQLATQTAIWVLTVAAQVVMVERGESTLVVAMVQSAVTLPFLVFTIPSGVLADLVSRRGVLVVTNLAAVVVGVVLTISSGADVLGAPLLLCLTFLLGLAWAVNAPSFTAVVPDIVAREYIPAAGMLASIVFNAARVVGPALGGLVIALLGPTAAFGLSTLGYLAFAVAALLADVPERRSASRRFFPALRTGLRHVVNAEPFRRLVTVTAAWFVTGSAMFALLPVVALRELDLGPDEYGWVLAMLGGGAIVGTILLAPYRARVSSARYVSVVMPVFAACLLALGLVRAPWMLFVLLPVMGAAWTAVGAVLLALAQQLLPGWVRARGMAFYLMASQGGMAAGAFLWGALGNRFGTAAAFAVAAVAVLPIWAVALRGRFPEVRVRGEVDGWPLPESMPADDELDRRARVDVEWEVPADRRAEFLAAMPALRRSRRRTGARRWTLSSDVERPTRFVESWTVDSWHDHLEQHELRQEPEDAEASRAVRRIVGPPVEIRHFVDEVD